jgi:hypothetical protein
MAEANSYVAYISDSPASASPYWVAQDAGILKKHGLDVDLIFINGSTRAIQSLIAGDVSFSSGAGNAVINGKLAGADIAIINSLTNTLKARPNKRCACSLLYRFPEQSPAPSATPALTSPVSEKGCFNFLFVMRWE